MTDVIFPGMRGSVGLGADGSLARRPENWREMILMLYPNGQAPLTALTALMGSEKTDDPIFHWFEKELPAQRATMAGTGLSVVSLGGVAVPNTTAIAAGDTVYWECAAADSGNFKVGHVVHLIATASILPLRSRLAMLVTAVASNGITGKLIAATGTGGALLGSLYTVGIVGGSAHSEGATSGTSLAYDPSDYSNYTQIFRDSLENTRTASKTRLRTGDAIAQAKKECLELHSIGMERAFFYNPAKYVTTGTNGQPLRTTAGIHGFIASNRWEFRAVTGMGSTSWADTAAVAAKQYAWLMEKLEQIFRYGSTEKIGFCGSGVLLGIQQLLAMLPSSQVALSSGTTAYGFKVQSLITPFGTLHLKNHPLFTMDAAYRNDMVIVDTKFIKYRFVDDTSYKPNRQANDLDGEKSEFLTECGLELNFEKAHAVINGLGLGAAS